LVESVPAATKEPSRLAVDDAIVAEIRAFEIANSIFVSHSKRKRIEGTGKGFQAVRTFFASRWPEGADKMCTLRPGADIA